MFLEMGEDGELMFISAKQVEIFFKEEPRVFAAMGIDCKTVIREL